MDGFRNAALKKYGKVQYNLKLKVSALRIILKTCQWQIDKNFDLRGFCDTLMKGCNCRYDADTSSLESPLETDTDVQKRSDARKHRALRRIKDNSLCLYIMSTVYMACYSFFCIFVLTLIKVNQFIWWDRKRCLWLQTDLHYAGIMHHLQDCRQQLRQRRHLVWCSFQLLTVVSPSF